MNAKTFLPPSSPWPMNRNAYLPKIIFMFFSDCISVHKSITKPTIILFHNSFMSQAISVAFIEYLIDATICATVVHIVHRTI